MSEKELRACFEEQWKPEPIKIPGSRDYFMGVDVKPIGRPKGILVGALGIIAANMQVIREGLFHISAAGYRVVAFEHNAPRYLINAPAGIPRKHLEMTCSIRDGMNHFGIDKADGLGHSQGGVALLTAGYLFPEKFDNFVVANLAAAEKPIPTKSKKGTEAERLERFARLARLFFKGAEQTPPIQEITDPIVRNFLEVAGKESLKILLKHPFQTYQEGITTSNADIRWMMRYLRTVNNQRIGMIVNTEDLPYPIERILASLGKDPYSPDIVAPIKGSHHQMILEMSKHIALGIEVLEALRELQKNPSSRLDRFQLWESVEVRHS